MKPSAFILAIFLFLSYGCVGESEDAGSGTELADTACVPIPWPDSLPVYEHVVIVVEENKDYDEVIGDPPPAPYINKTLKAEGANFTQVFGEEHYSQGNYFWLFSGDDQDVGFTDQIPNKANNPNYPFTAPNLGQQLIDKGLSFKGYAESLPAGICEKCLKEHYPGEAV